SGCISGIISFTHNGDAIIATFSSPGDAASANAGSYSIGAALSGAKLFDYTYGDLSNLGTLVVSKAALTVTADYQSKVYGAADPFLTYTVTGTTYYGDVALSVVKSTPVTPTHYTITDLSDGIASELNDSGQVTGQRFPSGVPFLFSNGVLTTIANEGG